MILFKRLFFCLLLMLSLEPVVNAQPIAGGNPCNGNPLLPGYFADPTVKKFGDTYYIYATTDGVKLASGAPQVWISKDFANWYNYRLSIDLPHGLHNCWAPDVIHAADGRYYYFMGNCEQGCNIYGYVSDSPMGPFTPVNEGHAVIPAGTAKKDLPALDAQFLTDDDGSVYAYFGTWCTSFGGMGFAKIDPTDMHTILKTGFIPISQIPKAFEGAYPIKRNGRYFLMYSAGDCRLSSYAVYYSVADSPEGPFRPGKNSPVLVTCHDGTIDGPGHHSILQDGDNYYIVYHRHDNPHSTGGEFRQVCADKLVFADDETIEKIEPTLTGIAITVPQTDVVPVNLALNAKVTASSSYHLVAGPTTYSPQGYDYRYAPENAVDDDNGTLWKAASARLPQTLTIDLGKTLSVKRVMIQFEYPTFYYQYKTEVSLDGVHWQLFNDKTANRRCGSPMIDDNDMPSRYIKITVTGTEKTGMLPAIWNVRVYDSLFETPLFQNSVSKEGPGAPSSQRLLVDFRAANLTLGTLKPAIPNKGALGGHFNVSGQPEIVSKNGIKSLYLDGNSYLTLSVNAPASLDWNAPFTASVWVFNPEIGTGECLMTWNSRDDMLQSSYAALMYGTGHYGAMAHGDGAVDLPYKSIPEKGKWHHIAVTFDGVLENVYVDGKLNTQQPITLFVKNSAILIGTSGEPAESFTGYIACAQLFDKALTSSEIMRLKEQTNPKQTQKK